MSKLWEVANQKIVVFECPGCGYGHAVYYDGNKNPNGASWEWNHSKDAPTFHPSILIHDPRGGAQCHSFVRDGNIQFLTDSKHKLAGQTVPLPDIEDYP